MPLEGTVVATKLSAPTGGPLVRGSSGATFAHPEWSVVAADECTSFLESRLTARQLSSEQISSSPLPSSHLESVWPCQPLGGHSSCADPVATVLTSRWRLERQCAA